jgi:hypothetical protein
MILKIARQHAAQGTLAQDDDVIHAFTADRTDQRRSVTTNGGTRCTTKIFFSAPSLVKNLFSDGASWSIFVNALFQRRWATPMSGSSRVPAAKRVQYAALPYRSSSVRTEVMLVTSRETRRWIIPKGWPQKGKATSTYVPCVLASVFVGALPLTGRHVPRRPPNGHS